jgi:uncharacterized membrane protein YfcA
MAFPDLGWLAGSESASAETVLLVAALVSGVVRGFTGFGFAMVFVPLATFVVAPPVAVGLVWALDAPYALPLAAGSLRRAQWGEVVPLLIGATALLPLGAWLLTHLEPRLTRWIVAVVVLAAVAALASGWRYRTRPSRALSLGVGGLSGLSGGVAGLSGLPLAIFWLGSQHNDAAQTRHNLMAYFGLSTVIMGIIFAWQGVVTLPVLAQALLLILPYGAGIWIGARGFRRASDPLFRAVAYAVIAAAAVLAMPVFDGWLR